MNVVPTRYELPLFLASRNSIRKNKIDELRQYIRKKAEEYTDKCKDDKVPLSATHKKLLDTIGAPRRPMQTQYPSLCKRTEERLKLASEEHLPPNLYDTTPIPYSSRKGCSGAYWKKLNKDKDKKAEEMKRDDKFKFYDKPSNLDKSNTGWLKYKGRIGPNLRHFQASSRMMISDLALVERDPDEPAPNAYSVHNYELQNQATPHKLPALLRPHKFYKGTTVPVSEARYPIKTRRICAGPGRYEIRFKKVCACRPRKIYAPDLYIRIDREKRYKFRRQKWSRIRKRFYCDPTLKHIPGRGHSFLFKVKRQKKNKKEERRLKKKTTRALTMRSLLKPLKLFPDARYRDIINNTPTRVDSIWYYKPMSEFKIKFNTIAKVKWKRKGKKGKKVAFLSTAPRFKDDEPRRTLTPDEILNIINSLPENLRVQKKPVSKKRLSNITARLYETKSISKRVVPKPPMKIANWPRTIILASVKEIQVRPHVSTPFYMDSINAKEFQNLPDPRLPKVPSVEDNDDDPNCSVQ